MIPRQHRAREALGAVVEAADRAVAAARAVSQEWQVKRDRAARQWTEAEAEAQMNMDSVDYLADACKYVGASANADDDLWGDAAEFAGMSPADLGGGDFGYGDAVTGPGGVEREGEECRRAFPGGGCGRDGRDGGALGGGENGDRRPGRARARGARVGRDGPVESASFPSERDG